MSVNQLGTSYLNDLSEVLADHGFIPSNQISRDSNPTQKLFLPYEFFQVPTQYELHCSQAKMLWRTWWKSYKKSQYKPLSMALVIRLRGTWYPIKDISVSQGSIYIRTL